jgi:hypothetical protein
MNLISTPPPARLKRRLDQTPNATMKAPVLGFTFGILVAVLLERSRPVTMAAIRNLRSSHGLTSLSPARDRVVQMPMAARILIANEEFGASAVRRTRPRRMKS